MPVIITWQQLTISTKVQQLWMDISCSHLKAIHVAKCLEIVDVYLARNISYLALNHYSITFGRGTPRWPFSVTLQNHLVAGYSASSFTTDGLYLRFVATLILTLRMVSLTCSLLMTVINNPSPVVYIGNLFIIHKCLLMTANLLHYRFYCKIYFTRTVIHSLGHLWPLSFLKSLMTWPFPSSSP